MLVVEVTIPEDLTSHDDELLGKLLDELVRKGGEWGIQVRATLGREQAS
jgi:hypothetical protein